MPFRDIIGQDEVLDILKGFLSMDRVPHTLCFAGDEGIGKRLSAVSFAMALNCTGNSSEDDLFSTDIVSGADESTDNSANDACGGCPSCRKIINGNHPDLHLLAPGGDARQIKVSDVRQLEEALSFKPFEGRWKVAIVDDADRMNQSAANSFLKTLEEPTEQSVIILVTSRPDMLLSTILSRCQMLRFSPLPVDDLSGFLAESGKGMPEEEALLRTRLSGGRPGPALSDEILQKREWSLEVIKDMVSSPDRDAWTGKGDMEEWFEWSGIWIRDFAVLLATGDPGLLINADLKDDIKSLVRNARLDDLLKLGRDLNDIKRRLTLNLNKLLTFNYAGMLVRSALGGRGV